MMLGMERSSRCSVSEQSSTARSTAVSWGAPRSTSDARANPAAPATQPSPKMGTRFTSGRRPSRSTMRPSMEGVAMPVTVTK